MTTKFVSNVHSFHSFYFSQLREWFVFRVYPMRKRKKWLLTRVTIFTWLKRRRLFLDSWDSFPWPRWPPRTQHDEINSIDFFSPFSSSNGNTHCILVQNYRFFFFFFSFFLFYNDPVFLLLSKAKDRRLISSLSPSRLYFRRIVGTFPSSYSLRFNEW